MSMQEYTTGAGNWTVPAAVYACDVLLVGGGGGGHDTATPRGGGGGGGVILATEYPVLPGDTVAYAVGAAAAVETDGNDTTFDNVLIASGGKKGVQSTGGAGGAAMGTAGGVADAVSPYAAKGKAYLGEVGGAGGGSASEAPGADSPFAGGGTGAVNMAGGGASWGAGGNGGVAGAANTGGGGGGDGGGVAAGGSGYIRITWSADMSNFGAELAKVPKSDAGVSWNATALAAIKTQAAAVQTDANSELGSMPASTAGFGAMIQYVFEKMRHKSTMNKDTGVETLMKDDGTTPLGTATHTDDGTTVTKAEMT